MALSEKQLEKSAFREGRGLLREASRALSRAGARLAASARAEIVEAADTLRNALRARDKDRVCASVARVDNLLEEHLSAVRKSTTREYIESIGVAVLIALLLRAFVVEAFKIPSGSMIPTLEVGDHIFVNKFIYGVRIPYTTVKFFEFREPKRGEVIVFMNPCEPDKDFIKRIVAVAGDTVEVRCDVLYVNGKEVPAKLIDAEECVYWNRDEDEDEGVTPVTEVACSRYTETMDGENYDTLHPRARPDQDKRSAENHLFAHERRIETDFPIRQGFACSGPDHRTAEQKNRSQGKFEPSITAPDIDRGSCQLREHYVVPPGHIFAMGDNRSNSQDSRFWGPVPIENIKGKALFIWWAKKQEGNGWRGVELSRIGHVVK